MNPQSPNYDHIDNFVRSLNKLIGDPPNTLVGTNRKDIQNAKAHKGS